MTVLCIHVFVLPFLSLFQGFVDTLFCLCSSFSWHCSHCLHSNIVISTTLYASVLHFVVLCSSFLYPAFPCSLLLLSSSIVSPFSAPPLFIHCFSVLCSSSLYPLFSLFSGITLFIHCFLCSLVLLSLSVVFSIQCSACAFLNSDLFINRSKAARDQEDDIKVQR